MARAWLKVEGSIAKHPKVLKLAAAFGVHPYLVVGFLTAWWDFCAEFATQGRAAICPDSTLDELAIPVQKAATKLQLPTMKIALRSARLMDRDGRPHDWQDYAGALITRRAKDAQRKKLARVMSAAVSADSPRNGAPQSRDREEKRKTASRSVTEAKGPTRITGAEFREMFKEPAA